jgi:hypothetical protein
MLRAYLMIPRDRDMSADPATTGITAMSPELPELDRNWKIRAR